MQAILAIAMLYGVILVFVLMGSRNFFSGRVIVGNPFVVAGVLTGLALIVIAWGEFWGSHAWPAFGALCAALVVGFMVWNSRASR